MKIRYAAWVAAIAALATSASLFASEVGAQQKIQQKPKADPNIACLNNLKQCAIGMMMYVQDYDEKFPPMQTAKHVQNRLRPYMKREAVFTCPVTRQPYQPLKALSGKSMAGIKDPRTTTMLFDAKPHPDGTEHTAYADGHVKRTKP